MKRFGTACRIGFVTVLLLLPYANVQAQLTAVFSRAAAHEAAREAQGSARAIEHSSSFGGTHSYSMHTPTHVSAEHAAIPHNSNNGTHWVEGYGTVSTLHPPTPVHAETNFARTEVKAAPQRTEAKLSHTAPSAPSTVRKETAVAKTSTPSGITASKPPSNFAQRETTAARNEVKAAPQRLETKLSRNASPAQSTIRKETTAAKSSGLTTPNNYFNVKTKSEVDQLLTRKFGPAKSDRSVAKTFYNPNSKRSFNLHEEAGHVDGMPHVDIRRRGNYPDRQYPLKRSED